MRHAIVVRVFAVAFSFLAILSALTAFTSIAQAQSPVPYERYISWTGFYMGVNGGYAWTRDDVDFKGLGQIFFNADQTCIQNNGFSPKFCAVQNAFSGPGAEIDNIHDRGGLIGGHAGYNWQLGSWVVGVEGDIDAANIKGSSATSGTNSESVITVGNLGANVQHSGNVPVTRSVNIQSKLDELAWLSQGR